jgi:hypothetical protein
MMGERTLAKCPQVWMIAASYADDGYIQVKMSVVLQVLADLHHVLYRSTKTLNLTSMCPKLPSYPTGASEF